MLFVKVNVASVDYEIGDTLLDLEDHYLEVWEWIDSHKTLVTEDEAKILWKSPDCYICDEKHYMLQLNTQEDYNKFFDVKDYVTVTKV